MPSAGVYRPARPAQAEVPPDKAERARLRDVIRTHVRESQPVPPLTMGELDRHAEAVEAAAGVGAEFRKYLVVMLNNEVWRETLATVPYDRRLLLLPQCLRHLPDCKAKIDEYGLVCAGCGACVLPELQAEAEKLGYSVLVAEGTAVVTSLVASGKIQAIVGASCLSVLEKIFPYMEAGAMPGLAIPLLCDGCEETGVDLDWLWEAIYLTSDDKTRLLDLDALRLQVASWFTAEALDEVLGAPAGRTEEIAREWLSGAGKRWRPFLAACAFAAMQDDPAAPLPEGLRNVAVAVECFHKASLIHDDIEDADETRYGRPTLHVAHGEAIAINAGDFLLGEGYRLLAECDAPPPARVEMLSAAAQGHRQLCLGQGAELHWRREGGVLTVAEVLEIFAHKTAPAFEVALLLGAIYAGGGEDVREVLTDYSRALGIAYQIRDDLKDATPTGAAERGELSILSALAREQGGADATEAASAASRRARELMESYEHQAVLSLRSLAAASLKGLLRRVIAKIFTSNTGVGKTNDHTRGNASGGKPGAESVA